MNLKTVVIVILAGLCVIGLWDRWFYTPDDTYIYLRYADVGNRPGYPWAIWNRGFDSSDGASSVLWMFAVSYLMATLTLVKLASAAALIATVVLLGIRSGPLAALPIVLFGYSYSVGASGMETALAALLYLCLMYDKTTNWVTIVLAMMVRPESPFVVIALLSLRGTDWNYKGLVIAAVGVIVMRVLLVQGNVYTSVLAKMRNPGAYFDFWRYFFPLIPALLAYAATRRRAKLILICAALLLAWSGKSSAKYAKQYADSFQAHVECAEHIVPRDTLALSDVGYIPWKSRAIYCIDLVGLCTPEIAYGTDPAEVVERVKPTVVVLISQDEREFIALLPHEWSVHAVIQDTYTLERVDTFGPAYNLFTYRRNK